MAQQRYKDAEGWLAKGDQKLLETQGLLAEQKAARKVGRPPSQGPWAPCSTTGPALPEPRGEPSHPHLQSLLAASAAAPRPPTSRQEGEPCRAHRNPSSASMAAYRQLPPASDGFRSPPWCKSGAPPAAPTSTPPGTMPLPPLPCGAAARELRCVSTRGTVHNQQIPARPPPYPSAPLHLSPALQARSRIADRVHRWGGGEGGMARPCPEAQAVLGLRGCAHPGSMLMSSPPDEGALLQHHRNNSETGNLKPSSLGADCGGAAPEERGSPCFGTGAGK